MQIEDALNLLDEMMDSAVSVPLTNGKCLVDIDKVRDIIDDIRMNMPGEIQQAESLLVQKDSILSHANAEAENVIKKAEERARVILAQDKLVKESQQKASEILSQAQIQAKEIRLATQKFSDNVLKESEDTIIRTLESIRNTRKALRTQTIK